MVRIESQLIPDNALQLSLALFFLALSSCSTTTGSPQDSDDCWSYISQAIKLRDHGEYRAALKQIEKHNSCDKSANRMSYYYHLGWTHHEMGEYEKAVSALTHGLSYQPDYAYAYIRRGLAYERLGEVAMAGSDFKYGYDIAMTTHPDKFSEFLERNPTIKEKLEGKQ